MRAAQSRGFRAVFLFFLSEGSLTKDLPEVTGAFLRRKRQKEQHNL
jgi:hypothetical protein